MTEPTIDQDSIDQDSNAQDSIDQDSIDQDSIDQDRAIPAGMVLARTTDVFDNDSVPAGLLRAHRVADGVWGRLVVRAGSVRFVFEDDPDGAVLVSKGGAAAIPPGRHHHVELVGPCAFVVEFYRQPSATDGGLESTGLPE